VVLSIDGDLHTATVRTVPSCTTSASAAASSYWSVRVCGGAVAGVVDPAVMISHTTPMVGIALHAAHVVVVPLHVIVMLLMRTLNTSVMLAHGVLMPDTVLCINSVDVVLCVNAILCMHAIHTSLMIHSVHVINVIHVRHLREVAAGR
jgi:hypothetical protein